MERPLDRLSPPRNAGGTAGEIFKGVSRSLLFAAMLVVALWFLYVTRQLILLTVLVVIISIVVNEPVRWLERRGVGRGAATVLTILGLLTAAAGVGYLFVPRLLQELPALIEEVPRMIERLSQQASTWFSGSPEVERQFTRLAEWVDRGLGETWRIADSLVAAVILFLFTTAMVLYVVADPDPLVRWFLHTSPPRKREALVRAFHRSSRMVVGWVFANAILGVVKVLAVFLFLTWMDVPAALVWSLPALFSALIPRLGFYLMSIPPLFASLTVGWATALWTALFLVVFSEFLGNFVAPRVQGEIMQLHPAYLLFMTLALGLAFGLLGIIVAGPVAGFLRVGYDEFYLPGRAEE